jgi:hypothetical protein
LFTLKNPSAVPSSSSLAVRRSSAAGSGTCEICCSPFQLSVCLLCYWRAVRCLGCDVANVLYCSGALQSTTLKIISSTRVREESFQMVSLLRW